MTGAAREAGAAWRGWPRVGPFGDAAVLVDLLRAPGPETTALVHDLATYLAEHIPTGSSASPTADGWEPPIPAASTILVPVDPVAPGAAAAVAQVEEIVGRWQPLASRHAEAPDVASIIEIPVRYGGAHGPDLAEVAALAGRTPEEVIAAHARPVYTVSFLGFAPGFAYLGPLAPELVLARRPVPRPRVTAGSVAIGGPQTGVYPVDGPGGWWLIGWTDAPIWDPARTPPALFSPGARVRFRPVDPG